MDVRQSLANRAIAESLREHGLKVGKVDNFVIALDASMPPARLHQALGEVQQVDAAGLRTPVSDKAVAQLKFSECLPMDLARRVLAERMSDRRATTETLSGPLVRTTIQV